MASNNSSYGTSWADQWDNDPDPLPVSEKKASSNITGGGGKAAKYTEKMKDGLGKTKEVASQGVQKVKAGASVGVRWIKDKYHKTSRKLS